MDFGRFCNETFNVSCLELAILAWKGDMNLIKNSVLNEKIGLTW